MGEVSNMVVTVSGDITELKKSMQEGGVVIKGFADKGIFHLEKLDKQIVSTSGYFVKLPTLLNKSSDSFSGLGNVFKSISEKLEPFEQGLHNLFHSVFEGASEAGSGIARMAASAASAGGPLTLLGGVLLVKVVASLYEVVTAENETVKAQRELNAEMLKASASVAGEVANLNSLVAIAKNVNLSYGERQSAIEKINKQYPELNGNINLENINTRGVTKALNEQTEALKRNASIKAVMALIDKESAQIEAGRALLAEAKLPEALKFKLIQDLQKANGVIDVYIKRLDELNNANAKAKEGGKPIEFVQPADGMNFKQRLDLLKDQQAHELSLVQGNKRKIYEVNKEFYQKEIDLRKQFGALYGQAELELNKPFKPTKTKKEVETISDALSKLDRQINVIKQEEIIFNTDKAKEKISAIEGTIKHLVDKFKLTANSSFILNLEARIQGIKLEEFAKDVFKGKDIAPIQLPFEILFDNSPTNEANIERAKKELQDQIGSAFGNQTEAVQLGLNIKPFSNAGDVDRSIKEANLIGRGISKAFLDGLSNKDLDDFYENQVEKLKEFQKSVKDSIKNIGTVGFESLGETIGNALGGKDVAQGIFDSLFSSIGDQIETLGKFLIKSGIEIKIAKDAFKKLLANPVAAIGVGIGLVALGALIKSQLAKKAPGFASGGAIDGPGTKTSDSILARLSKGEYVIKADTVAKFGTGFFDKLNSGNLPKNFIPNFSLNLPKFSTGGLVTPIIQRNIMQGVNTVSVKEVPYIAETRLSGQDLRLMLIRADKQASTIG